MCFTQKNTTKSTLATHQTYSKDYSPTNQLTTKGWTIKFRPWKLIYKEEFETKQEAMKRDKQLKSYQGRQFIWNLIRKNQTNSLGSYQPTG